MKSAPCLLFIFIFMLAGCTTGPKYQRPAVAIPGQYRDAPANAAAGSLTDTKWPDLFQDDTLKQLIAVALEQNFDLALAAAHLEEARAQFRVTGANRYPFLYTQAGFTANRPSLIGSNTGPSTGSMDVSYTQAGGALSWELDLWGRIRSLNAASRAQFLASEEARHGVIVSLIADVADTWFTLRERDLELEIARSTREIAAHSLDLVRVRHEHGAVTALDVHQAEELLYVASAQMAATERDIAQTENALNLLLGRTPGAIARAKATDDYGLPPELPPGLPSSLLERRPDIREAEQKLIAANARIGAARAYYFPQISLTGFLGGQSRALTDLFTGPARDWIVTPAASLPIFTAGQVRAAVRLSQAQKQEMVVAYQKTIYNGLREVSDALVGYQDTRAERRQRDQLVHALEETTRLANLRYRGGMDSYLQVLDAERALFQGRLALAQVRLRELLAFVQVYRALGGGWQ